MKVPNTNKSQRSKDLHSLRLQLELLKPEQALREKNFASTIVVFGSVRIDPDLCFQFQYFALCKMHFLLHAKALIAYPGGFGTLDEAFEVLTLVQTKKMKRLPIILLGKEYW